MKNLTNYNSQFILSLIEQAHGNPYKCTANVQWAVEGSHIIPVLVIYQDNSQSWDIDDVVLFCERVAAIEFCDMNMSIDDLFTMISYYETKSFQDAVNDIEYEIECEEYQQAMIAELDWYNHARMMGWE